VSRQARPLADRFWSKVDRSGGPGSCWLWTASLVKGYGQMYVATPDGRFGVRSAHRLAYELTHGPAAEGLELDHLCRVRRCVNPAHLEPVLHRENMERSPIVGRNRSGWRLRPGAMRSARRGLGMTQVDLGCRLGMSHYTVYKLETGKRLQPRGDTVPRIAAVLGVPIEALADWVQAVDPTAVPELAGAA